jgi:hypothetical protein
MKGDDFHLTGNLVEGPIGFEAVPGEGSIVDHDG